MAAEPGPPSTPSEHAAGDAPPGGRAPAPVTAAERCGPVVIARHEKADGRALILYRRAEDRPA
jgi:hypothetical protein